MSFWDTFKTDRREPKYLGICDALAAAIEDGRLGPGRRLPSHRQLAQRLGVSVGTVTRAYELAIERGWITGEVGTGTFVRHRRLPPLSVVDTSRYRPECIDLYQNFAVLVPEIENELWDQALVTLRRQTDLTTLNRASFSEVLARHRHMGAVWIRRTGFEPAPKNLFDCPGTLSTLSGILGCIARPGDVVLAASLSFPAIRSLAAQYHLKVHGLPLDEEGIELEALEIACRELSPVLLYCEPTLHSPTALTMPEERRRAVATIARRYDMLIVEEEAAAFLLSEPLLPICAFAPERCFLLGEVWLALSSGLRTTYLHVPDAFVDRMSAVIAANSGIAAPLVAEVTAMWIESGAVDGLIERRRTELKSRNAILHENLAHRRIRHHQEGHHAWLELPPTWTLDAFVALAEQNGVAVTSADWFSFGGGTVPAAVRICLGNAPDHEVLGRALRRIDQLLDSIPAVAQR